MITIKDKTYDELKELLNSYMDKNYVEFIEKYYEQAKIVYDGMKRETGEDYIVLNEKKLKKHIMILSVYIHFIEFDDIK